MVIGRGVHLVSRKFILYSLTCAVFLLFAALGVQAQTVTFTNPAADNAYIGGTVAITVSISGFTNASNYTINLTNAAGTAIGIANKTVVQSDNNSGSVSLNWPSGNGTYSDSTAYTLYATIHDQDGSQTVSSFTVAVDNTVPNGTITLFDENLKESSTQQFDYSDSMTVDCKASDDLTGLSTTRSSIDMLTPGSSTFENFSSPSLDNSTLTIILGTGDTSTIGTHTIRCVIVDNSGNANNSNITFTIGKKVSSGGSVFSDEGWVAPISKKIIGKGSIEDLGVLPEDGAARLMAKQAGASVTLGSVDNIAMIDDIGSNSVTISVTPEGGEPITMELGENETKTIDTNGDSYDELSIFLNKIHNSKADIRFTEIFVEAAPIVEEPVDTPVVADTPSEPAPVVEEEKKSYTWLWILLVIVVIAVILMFVLHRLSQKGDASGGGGVKFNQRDLGVGREGSVVQPGSGASAQGMPPQQSNASERAGPSFY